MNHQYTSIHRGRPGGAGWRCMSIGLAACCCVLLGLPLQASAAGYATISLGSGHGSQMKVEWLNSSTARFQPGSSDSYTILQNGKIYIVTGSGQVMSGDFMKRMAMGHRNGNNAQAMQYAKPTLQGPFGSETDAGIRGDIYKVKYGGKMNEVVLTDNPLVKQLTQVWIAYAASMGNNTRMASQGMREMFDNKGELRAGNNFRLASINGNRPPASDFVLPAKPTSMPAMPDMSSMFSGHPPSQGAAPGQYNQGNGGNAGNGQSNQAYGGNTGNGQPSQASGSNAGSSGSSSGSLFDSIRNKFKQAEQRQSDHVDNKVTQKTNNVVDHAVDNVLGKLLGN